MGRGRSPRLSRKTVARVSLEIEKRGKVAVAHLRIRFGGDNGLCPIGNAEPSRLQHGEVVCAVANDLAPGTDILVIWPSGSTPAFHCLSKKSPNVGKAQRGM